MTSLKPGDYFCTASVGEGKKWTDKLLSASIRRFEILKSKDRQAFYTHAGVILNEEGDTFEARWHYGRYHINDYKGGPILIGRCPKMGSWQHHKGVLSIIKYNKKLYPLHVLFMMMIPGLAYIRPSGKPVCSELDCKHMIGSGIPQLIQQVGTWKNQTPDDVADMIKKWDAFDVVLETKNFEGV